MKSIGVAQGGLGEGGAGGGGADGGADGGEGEGGGGEGSGGEGLSGEGGGGRRGGGGEGCGGEGGGGSMGGGGEGGGGSAGGGAGYHVDALVIGRHVGVCSEVPGRRNSAPLYAVDAPEIHGRDRVEVERVRIGAAIDGILAAVIVGTGTWDVIRREAVSTARESVDATLEHGGGRVEVSRHSVDAPVDVDGESAAVVIRVRNRQIIGRPGVVRRFGPVIHRPWVPAEGTATGVAELPAAGRNAATEKRDVDGDGGVCSHAAYDAARSIILVVRGLVVKGSRVGASRKQRRAEPVVECGHRVVIRTHAVGTPAIRALATGGVGTLVEVQSERVEAAEHGGNALSGQCGRRVVIERGRVGTSLVKARAVLEGSQHAVIARVGLHAPLQHGRAAAVIEGRRRVEDLKAAVHAAALDARSVVHHGEDAVVQRRAGGAAVVAARARAMAAAARATAASTTASAVKAAAAATAAAATAAATASRRWHCSSHLHRTDGPSVLVVRGLEDGATARVGRFRRIGGDGAEADCLPVGQGDLEGNVELSTEVIVGAREGGIRHTPFVGHVWRASRWGEVQELEGLGPLTCVASGLPSKYRFSTHTWKVTLSLTSMAAGLTPGHDCFRHAVMDVDDDAWQIFWADVNEESSMASWAQRISRVVAGVLALVALVALAKAAPSADSPCSSFASSVASSLFDFRPARLPCRQRAGAESCMSSHWATGTWSGGQG
eukprot:scaffold58106_cov55-Phaeocystis_antarctica.AAC.2